MLSLITPPNCLATYTAAAIARSDFWQTGWTGMRLGIAAYIVPFAFALHPALILKGSAGDISLAVVASAIGTFLLAVGCAGYLFRGLDWLKRGLFILAGLLLMLPTWHGTWLILDATGVLLGIGLFVWEKSKSSLERSATAAPSGVAR
jgi:TRAP-type uncharacterized transport system fused permease subunit